MTRKRIGRIALAGFVIILAVILIGPFLVPVPPLEDTHPPQALADSDSQFIRGDSRKRPIAHAGNDNLRPSGDERRQAAFKAGFPEAFKR